MWWKREPPAVDWQTMNGTIEMLVRIDARVEQLVQHFGVDDEEEDDES